MISGPAQRGGCGARGRQTRRSLADRGCKRDTVEFRLYFSRSGRRMPDIRRKIASAENVIIESNSVIRFLRPDLYLSVLDAETADFKDSAREFLDRADALILHKNDENPRWNSVSLKPVAGRPFFLIEPPPYVTPEIVSFIRGRIKIDLPQSAPRVQ